MKPVWPYPDPGSHISIIIATYLSYMTLDKQRRPALAMCADSKRGENSKLERIAGSGFGRQTKYRRSWGCQAQNCSRGACHKPRKRRTPQVGAECRAGIAGLGIAARHRAMMLPASPAASRHVRLIVRPEQRGQQRQAEQKQEQKCRNTPQDT